MRSYIITFCIALLLAAGCAGCRAEGASNSSAQASGSDSASAPGSDSASAAAGVPMPRADSLMAFIERQVAFGPRTPGSEAHAACRKWLHASLARYLGEENVATTPVEVTDFNGRKLTAYNIFARYNPDASRRIILLAHYDTRPWADQESDPKLHSTPIDGANDGASGVAVLLEVARQLAGNPIDSLGVDLLMVDLEDSGDPRGGNDDSWCLGSSKFAENLPYGNTDRPYLGVLFDMVGGRGATFPREVLSQQHAKAAVDKLWALAHANGLGGRFPNRLGAPVIDDHLPLIRAGIPTVDIIDSANAATGSFPETWHTLADTPANIDTAPLVDATRLALLLLYSESSNNN